MGRSSTHSRASYEITNPDGSKTTVPTMTMQQTLSPAQQKLLNQQESLGYPGQQCRVAGVADGEPEAWLIP